MTEAEKIRYERYKLAYAALMLVYPFGLEDLEGEIWRWIEGYEGLYKISNFGRVKSFCLNKIQILKPTLTRYGYLVVDLHKNGKHKSHRLHILVAKAFIPNNENKPEVNHKSGNKLDCSVENLEWMTSAENHQHAAKTGLKKRPTNSKLNYEIAEYCRSVYIPRDPEFGVRALARKFHINHKSISKIIHGEFYKK